MTVNIFVHLLTVQAQTPLKVSIVEIGKDSGTVHFCLQFMIAVVLG